MADEQSHLIGSFPTFIDGIKTKLQDADGYHVGVTTTDAYAANGVGCTVDGALVTQTGGVSASNATCGPYAEGASYMTEKDDLAQTFACAAQVGTTGDGNERPMWAMGNAIGDALNAAGACNAGFLREDALLVLVIITDEEDDHETASCGGGYLPQAGSPDGPQEWFEYVVSRKSGIESNLVVLAMVGPEAPDACPPLDKCFNGIDGAEVASRILEFTRSFTYGFIGPVCAASYGEFFSEAVGHIESACRTFTPPA
jgi:hypothetical protein